MYRAVCLREIYWDGKIYRIDDVIKISEEDVSVLREAGVIGDIKKIEVEVAVKKAPETAKRTYKKRSK